MQTDMHTGVEKNAHIFGLLLALLRTCDGGDVDWMGREGKKKEERGEYISRHCVGV